MYTVIVEGNFSAVHRVRLPDGTLEPVHSHDWMVRVQVRRVELDRRGMVVDFCQARSALVSVLEELHDTDLNEHGAFSGHAPTAERVAKYVYDQLESGPITGVSRVEVREAPGCTAVYEPGHCLQTGLPD